AALERRHLLAQDRGLRMGQAAAAVLARPCGHGPAALAHALHPRALGIAPEREALAAPADVGLAAHGLPHLGRAVGFEPGPRGAAERVERTVGGNGTHRVSCIDPGVAAWVLSLSRA